jgi:hypothetical protein
MADGYKQEIKKTIVQCEWQPSITFSSAKQLAPDRPRPMPLF